MQLKETLSGNRVDGPSSWDGRGDGEVEAWVDGPRRFVKSIQWEGGACMAQYNLSLCLLVLFISSD